MGSLGFFADGVHANGLDIFVTVDTSNLKAEQEAELRRRVFRYAHESNAPLPPRENVTSRSCHPSMMPCEIGL